MEDRQDRQTPQKSELLVALIVAVPRGPGHWRDRRPYQAYKLYNSGNMESVAPENFDKAIKFMRNRGFKPFGFWIHNGPAIALSIGANFVTDAWKRANGADDLIMATPLTFYSRYFFDKKRSRAINTSVIFVGNWVIMPTRTGTQIARLREEYPGYSDDLAHAPLYVIRREHAKRREREIKAGGRGALAWARTRAY